MAFLQQSFWKISLAELTHLVPRETYYTYFSFGGSNLPLFGSITKRRVTIPIIIPPIPMTSYVVLHPRDVIKIMVIELRAPPRYTPKLYMELAVVRELGWK